jgi:Tol biopolymer transport system component
VVQSTADVTGWAARGRLVFMQANGNTGWDIGALEVETGVTKSLVATSANEVSLQVSPDGRWLAYASTESGRLEVWVQAFPNLEGKWQVSTAGGSQPRWRGDGRELFYISQDTPWRQTVSNLSSTRPFQILRARSSG